MPMASSGCGLDSGLPFYFGFVIGDPQLAELPVKVTQSLTLELLATIHQVDSPEEVLVRVQLVC